MTRHAVIAGTAAILVSLVFVFGLQVHQGYRRALAGAWDVVTVIAQVANDHAFRSFQSVETTLEQARFLEAQGLPADQSNIFDSTLVREIAVLDAGGSIVRSTLPGSIGARPFTAAELKRARAEPALVVFGTVTPRRTFGDLPQDAQRSQRYLFPAVMAAPGGGFIAAAVNPDYFGQVYTPGAATNELSITLLTLSAVVVASSAGSPPAIGTSLEGKPPFNGSVLNQQSGRIGESDDTTDLAFFRTTPLFPFVTLVSVPRAAVLDEWRSQTILLCSLLALVLLGAGMLFRQVDLRQRQQRRLEEAERASRMTRFLSAIVDSPSSLTAIVATDLGIVRANDSFRANLDCGTGNLRPVLKRSDVSGGERILEFAERRTQDAEDFDLTVSRGNGVFSILRFRLTWHVFPDFGDCLVLVGQDETRRRKTEMALAQSAKLITLGEMATGMAHELNQPLNVIKMAAQITQLELDEATAQGGTAAAMQVADLRRGLQQIATQVDRAASIIEHMRIFGRAPSGQAQPVDAVQVCRDAVSLVREQLRSLGIAIVVEDPGEELLVRIHRILIEQVIVNLAMNARDAISDDGRSTGTVQVRPQRAADGKVVILVSDDGPGVPAALRSRLFEPFFTTKPIGKGVGLGLAISFGIVRDSGGSLTLTDDGPGATFRIELSGCGQAVEHNGHGVG